jgi:hypothetical protein
MAVLDRILLNTKWDSKFSLSKVNILPRGCSDHKPLNICFGEKIRAKDHVFRFEKWWLEVEGFEELVRKVWGSECPSSDPMDKWQLKIRALRKKIKGWSRNIEAARNKRKREILAEIDLLDSKGEKVPLDARQKKYRQNLKEELEKVWKR